MRAAKAAGVGAIITLVLAAALFFSGGSAPVPGKVRVLFIGNSLTSANNLPGLIEAVAEERGQVFDWNMSAPGSYRLYQHAAFGGTLNLINTGDWDYIVLQEQSQLPSFPQSEMKSRTLPYAQQLCAAIRAANPRTRIVFYETMARRSGDRVNGKIFPEVSTYSGMQKRLNAGYRQMAKENRTLLAPVGEVWQRVRAQLPSLNLYADEVHPNLAGSYLAACVFYALFFNQSPVGLPRPPALDNETAVYLQQATDKALISKGRFRLPGHSQ